MSSNPNPITFTATIEPINEPSLPATFDAKVTAQIPSQPPGGGGGTPPGIWGPLPGFPTPPIANVPGVPGYTPPGGGGTPPGIWGPPGPWPQPPIQLPWWILAGLQPPGFWGPLPGFPTPPIANVPGIDNPNPPGGGGGGGGNPPSGGNTPGHPILLPPPGQPPEGFQWVLVFVYGTGWVWVLLPSSEG